MTTVHKKRHGGIRRWLVRNSLSLALIGIILLSMTAGAIGCLAFLPKPQDTSTPETKIDVSTATVMQPDITSPSLDPVPEPQVFYFDVPLSEELQDYIREKCSEYEVPMELVIALIDKESSFRSDVVSTTNDYGFMQINQCNHEWLSSTLGVSNFLDPKENILCGIYMKQSSPTTRSCLSSGTKIGRARRELSYLRAATCTVPFMMFLRPLKTQSRPRLLPCGLKLAIRRRNTRNGISPSGRMMPTLWVTRFLTTISIGSPP